MEIASGEAAKQDESSKNNWVTEGAFSSKSGNFGDVNKLQLSKHQNGAIEAEKFQNDKNQIWK